MLIVDLQIELGAIQAENEIGDENQVIMPQSLPEPESVNRTNYLNIENLRG